MKKTVILAALVLILAACASSPQVKALTAPQMTAMSPSEVNTYYAAQNKKLLDKVLLNYGDDAYELVHPITTQMNNDLTNLSKRNITRSQYNDGVNTIVSRAQQKIDAAVEASKANS